ncbi:MAG TPA: pilin [Methylococcales bacterium]
MGSMYQFAQLVVNNLPKTPADKTALDTALSLTFEVAGSIALLMIVIGGFRYIIASGDPNSVSQAKKTILYAVIGLLVSMSAYSIVTIIIMRT